MLNTPGDKLKQRDLLLVIIDACHSRPEFGRTSLQKIAYFSSIESGRDLGHRAHYYGPYSHTVERDIEALKLSDLIEERAMGLGFASVTGFEAKKYEYRLTESGNARLSALRTAHSEDVEKVYDLVKRIVDLAGGLDQRVLSSAAKTLYISHEQGRDVSFSEISDLAREHGWELTPSKVEGVVRVLEGLGLVRVTEQPDG